MSSRLDDSVMYIKGVGPKRAELFKKLGVNTVRDLIYHLPRHYADFSAPTPIASAVIGTVCVVEGEIVSKNRPVMIRKGMTLYRLLVTDGSDDMSVVIYNAQYLFESLETGKKYLFMGKVVGKFTKKEMSGPTVIPKDSPVKILPTYPLTAGLSQASVTSCVKNALSAAKPEDVEFLPKDVVARSGMISELDALNSIHFPKSTEDFVLAKQRLSFDELLILRLGMMTLREKNRRETSYAMKQIPLDGFLDALPFQLTGAQMRSVYECMHDMSESTPMNRLILGDVGSGKTAVAAGCCYIAAKNGYQSVIMAPTEILAQQHFKSLRSFLRLADIKVGLLTGSMTKKQKTEIYERLASGELDVIAGTHALFQTGVEYKNLGLVITDEQHRFGVNQRSALAKKGQNPHRLVMSATPIPRTLALMIYGELDISILDELPAGRKKTETYAITGNLRDRACAFVARALDAGGQAYVVCPAVEEGEGDVKNVTDYAKELSEGSFKNYRVGVLHGQMPAAKKEEVMAAFKGHAIDVLVCTTVVEVGVDVPNATVMMVENADRFGLSQLHQLRGRVGRGDRDSYCILITDSVNDESCRRLKILSSTTNGFDISEADLKMRGPGNFFGSAQHGLPPLKIASLADAETVRLAQDIAENLFSTGRITLPGCAALRERVARLFEAAQD